MAKAKSTQIGSNIRPVATKPESEISRLRSAVERLNANPEQARRLMVNAGIYSSKGKLTKTYGG
ncbi:hypothetical protein [Uliginosibacterium sediminicola]|uniref:Uncharacterized protein n=1 Tax=Uliginosibacterium sediminicola TaxID=2024550 RepID=A0ABU9YW78_9RHOO